MKKVRIRSAIPIYAAAMVWVIAGFASKLYTLGSIVVTALLSAGVLAALEFFWPKRTVEVREKADSGDGEIDRQIEEGRARLDAIAAGGEKIGDAAVVRNISRMQIAGEAVFRALEKDVGKANDVRRFMNYYLPTAEELIQKYILLTETGVNGENISSARDSIRNSMGMIADAFEKQLDHLYKDEALDIETDIEVLETVLASEGLKEAGSPAQMGGN